MVIRKQTVVVSSLIALILLIGLMLMYRITSSKEEADHTSTIEDINSQPQQNVKRSRNAVEKKLDELHKRFNLEERENMKLEIMSFMHMVVLEAGAYEEGITEFQRLLKENPGNESICRRAYDFIVRYHIENGDYQEAMGQAKILIDTYPTSTEAFAGKLNIGLCNEKTSQWEEAKEIYRNLAEKLAVEIERDETDKSKNSIERRARLGLSYFRIGRCFFNQGKHQNAISEFEQAFKTMEGVKLRIGEGIEDWPSARISPMLYDDFAEALYLMGQSYQKLEKNIEAKNAYQQVIEKYPDSKEWVAKARERLTTMR